MTPPERLYRASERQETLDQETLDRLDALNRARALMQYAGLGDSHNWGLKSIERFNRTILGYIPERSDELYLFALSARAARQTGDAALAKSAFARGRDILTYRPSYETALDAPVEDYGGGVRILNELRALHAAMPDALHDDVASVITDHLEDPGRFMPVIASDGTAAEEGEAASFQEAVFRWVLASDDPAYFDSVYQAYAVRADFPTPDGAGKSYAARRAYLLKHARAAPERLRDKADAADAAADAEFSGGFLEPKYAEAERAKKQVRVSYALLLAQDAPALRARACERLDHVNRHLAPTYFLFVPPDLDNCLKDAMNDAVRNGAGRHVDQLEALFAILDPGAERLHAMALENAARGHEKQYAVGETIKRQLMARHKEAATDLYRETLCTGPAQGLAFDFLSATGDHGFMVEALEQCENIVLAERYLNSPVDALKRAANAWAEKRGYFAMDQSSACGVLVRPADPNHPCN